MTYHLTSDEVDCVKQTALHYAVSHPRPDPGVVAGLVKAGATVDARRMRDGWTPVFLAAVLGHQDQVTTGSFVCKGRIMIRSLA